jgi:hypothetical protein
MSYQPSSSSTARTPWVAFLVLGIIILSACSLTTLPLYAEETTTAPETSAPTETDSGDTASVVTGDANALLDVETEAGTNETTTLSEAPLETTTANENTTVSDTTGIVESATGDNAVMAPGGASVETGNAVSVANVVQVINTNIFNSQGLLYFLNALMGNIALDLRNAFSILTGNSPASSPCSLTDCADTGTTVTVSNQNIAEVTNTVSVTASTGNNTADAGSGDATIQTGDAYASANVVNVVNTNIVNSNYLLLSVNNFGAFGGDIVFPGAEWFQDLLAQSTIRPGSETTVTNTNTAQVSTVGEVQADTGDNTTGGTGTITTGDSHAGATVVNQVNTNIFGDSMLFLFRVHGNWAGNVFGLPEGMSWREGENGVELFLDPSGVSAPQGSTDRLTVTNSNTATVTNNVSVFALTGENHATSSEGGANIQTGDAYASANVVNVVNTNILGRNWVLAIFNIFGDWTGNISFGQPDLWVGARAVVPSNVRGGSCFDYEVTVNNLGDAVATNVVLDTGYRTNEQDISGFNHPSRTHPTVTIGRIEPRGTHLVTLTSCISRNVPGGSTLTTEFTASSRETDSHANNNTDRISITTVPGGGSALRLGASDLTVTKSSDTPVITASSTVNYTLVIKNNGGPVYNALLVDTIYNTAHVAMHEQRWGLGTILAGEEITISYSTDFNASTTPGVYSNEAFVFGIDRNPDIASNLGNRITSEIASVSILVRSEKEVREAPKICVPLLDSYMRRDLQNDVEDVRDLQTFLKTIGGYDEVEVTGEYDEATVAGVHALQEKYATDILTPWGITRTTGFVYYTTQKKINELWCKRAFPLAPFQEEEIANFKKKVDRYEAVDVPMPETEYEEIGMVPEAEPETRLALVETAPAPAPSAVAEAPLPESQLASVGAVDEGGIRKAWDAVKSTLFQAFAWVGW